MFPVLLASSSPRRRQLLEQVGFCVSVQTPDIDETPQAGERPDDLAVRLATQKAQAIASTTSRECPVGVAADTVVWTDGKALGKPADDEDASRMLRELSGKIHRVTTGYCVFDPAGDQPPVSRAVSTEVAFRRLHTSEIAAYVASGEPMGKAGGYAIQGRGALLVRGIHGSYTNVVGLPVTEVVETMREMGLLVGMPWEGDHV